jgi:hypothetical protein
MAITAADSTLDFIISFILTFLLTILKDFHQLVDYFVGVTTLMRRNNMILKMTSEHQSTDFIERTVDSLDLLEHINTVYLSVLQHLEDALDMPLDSEQALTRIFTCSGVKMQAVAIDVTHCITSAW